LIGCVVTCAFVIASSHGIACEGDSCILMREALILAERHRANSGGMAADGYHQAMVAGGNLW